MSEITPIFDETSSEPLYAQLYRYFRDGIQAGRIAANTRLPSVRHLSSASGVSKITVETAYQQLLAEGYVESKARSGYYVVEIEEFGYASQMIAGEESQLAREVAMALPTQVQNSQSSLRYNFHNTTIDLASFPMATWRKCMLEAMETFPDDFARYGHKQGEYELRSEIASYLRRARTVNCLPEQIVLGTGLLNSIGMLSLMFGKTHTKVAIEEPGYSDARYVFEQHGLEVVPIPLEEDGINLELLWQSGAQIVYVTPSHQYPHGMVMPIAKRIKLLEWAKRTGGIILENDYDGEFRYNVKPTPSLQGLDQHGSVVFCSDFSKSFSPAMRMNYMVLPPKLLLTYHEHFRVYSCPVSRLQQRTMQLFMGNGHWDKHLRKMRKIYERKHAVLMQAVSELFGAHVSIMAQQAGLHILLEMQSEQTEEELACSAASVGVKVYPISANWMTRRERHRPRILLGFGGLTEEEIRAGIGLLREAWFGESLCIL
jgi:GntR family transcriptional regulator/MocR family aminotransferase